MKVRFIKFFLFFLSSFFSIKIWANDEIKLVFIEPGQGLTEAWGHIGFKVSHENSSFFYSWALNGASPTLFIHLVRHSLHFQLHKEVWLDVANFYLEVSKRPIHMASFLGGEDSKKRLISGLFSTESQNELLDYNFYFKNCSTVLRDFLEVYLPAPLKKQVRSERVFKWNLLLREGAAYSAVKDR